MLLLPEEIENVPNVLQLQKHTDSVCNSDHQLFQQNWTEFSWDVDYQDSVGESILSEVIALPL